MPLRVRLSEGLGRTFIANAELMRISANVTADFGNVTDLGFGAGLRA